MTQNNEALVSLLHMLNKLENDVVKAKAAVQKMFDDGGVSAYASVPAAAPVQEDDGVTVVEGKFDGTFMQGSDGKAYPVPMNYASKTKLIPGDMLKLRVMEDGKLIYKVIGPAPRKFLKAKITKTEEGKFIALTEDNKTYSLNQAAVSFFKGAVGAEATIIINGGEESNCAAIEAVLGA